MQPTPATTPAARPTPGAGEGNPRGGAGQPGYRARMHESVNDGAAPGRIRRALRTAWSDVAGHHRPLLAVKTALAGVLAWYLAPYIPFAEDQYSYYAPLGALVTIYPTLARSTRSGVETVVGLGIGILIGLGGLAVVQAGMLPGVALALVLLIGVLVGGIRVLGSGREWVSLAGLFVLLLGGGDAEGFSVSYIVTMGFGVVVGILVNLLLPPLYVGRAGRRLAVLRDEIAGFLARTADRVADRSIDPERMLRDLSEIVAVEAEVGEDVQEAAESRRGNPRGRRATARDLSDENARRLAAMERAGFLLRDLVDVLLRMAEQGGPAEETRKPLAAALRRTAELMGAELREAGAPELLAAADAALADYRRAIDVELGMRPSEAAESVTTFLCLQRIVDVSRPFV